MTLFKYLSERSFYYERFRKLLNIKVDVINFKDATLSCLNDLKPHWQIANGKTDCFLCSLHGGFGKIYPSLPTEKFHLKSSVFVDWCLLVQKRFRGKIIFKKSTPFLFTRDMAAIGVEEWNVKMFVTVICCTVCFYFVIFFFHASFKEWENECPMTKLHLWAIMLHFLINVIDSKHFIAIEHPIMRILLYIL